MVQFVDLDYAEVERLWKATKRRARTVESYLEGLERGVPVELPTKADLTAPKAQQHIQTRVRNALKSLGYEDWADVMVVIHEGRVIVCRRFAEAPPRTGPTLRELDRREVATG